MASAEKALSWRLYALVQEGRLQAVLDLLGGVDLPLSSDHHRQRAYALHVLGHREAAHAAIGAALDTDHPDLKGTAYGELAVMLMREGDFQGGLRAYHQSLALLRHDRGRVQTLYNLAWTYLRRTELDLARDTCGEGLRLVSRSADPLARQQRPGFAGLLTHHARVTGQWDLALERAQQAVDCSPADRSRGAAFRALATTLRLSGELDGAREAQLRALDWTSEGREALTDRLHLMLIQLAQGEDVRSGLQVILPDAHPVDAARAQLQLARWSLLEGDHCAALGSLRAALAADEPFAVLDEAPALAGLYAWGQEAGLDLPAPAPGQTPRLHLTVRGQPQVALNGAVLEDLGAVHVGLLLSLHLEGPATPATLAGALFDLAPEERARGTQRIKRAAQAVRLFTCSDGAVVLEGGLYRLGAAWRVTSDLNGGHGPVLMELYGPWIATLQ
ncbi:tetratricopeptide repeat protein [Deinococcus marmoris]|uniref:tetratricopeptide repeat protein n=1 Tax=Deinococcus marmoris TaxID=249408 RepID=UPI000A9E683A|nr:hypothetical protein [Deinococcus marmoris]